MVTENKLKVNGSNLPRWTKEETIKVFLRREFKDNGCFDLWRADWDLKRTTYCRVLSDCQEIKNRIEAELSRSLQETKFLIMLRSWDQN
jgi:hypothetical protein